MKRTTFAPYQGGIKPVEGYIQAGQFIGQVTGNALASVGKSLAEGIKEYAKAKELDEQASAGLDSVGNLLLPYLTSKDTDMQLTVMPVAAGLQKARGGSTKEKLAALKSAEFLLGKLPSVYDMSQKEKARVQAEEVESYEAKSLSNTISNFLPSLELNPERRDLARNLFSVMSELEAAQNPQQRRLAIARAKSAITSIEPTIALQDKELAARAVRVATSPETIAQANQTTPAGTRSLSTTPISLVDAKGNPKSPQEALNEFRQQMSELTAKNPNYKKDPDAELTFMKNMEAAVRAAKAPPEVIDRWAKATADTQYFMLQKQFEEGFMTPEEAEEGDWYNSLFRDDAMKEALNFKPEVKADQKPKVKVDDVYVQNAAIAAKSLEEFNKGAVDETGKPTTVQSSALYDKEGKPQEFKSKDEQLNALIARRSEIFEEAVVKIGEDWDKKNKDNDNKDLRKKRLYIIERLSELGILNASKNAISAAHGNGEKATEAYKKLMAEAEAFILENYPEEAGTKLRDVKGGLLKATYDNFGTFLTGGGILGATAGLYKMSGSLPSIGVGDFGTRKYLEERSGRLERIAREQERRSLRARAQTAVDAVNAANPKAIKVTESSPDKNTRTLSASWSDGKAQRTEEVTLTRQGESVFPTRKINNRDYYLNKNGNWYPLPKGTTIPDLPKVAEAVSFSSQNGVDAMTVATRETKTILESGGSYPTKGGERPKAVEVKDLEAARKEEFKNAFASPEGQEILKRNGAVLDKKTPDYDAFQSDAFRRRAKLSPEKIKQINQELEDLVSRRLSSARGILNAGKSKRSNAIAYGTIGIQLANVAVATALDVKGKVFEDYQTMLSKDSPLYKEIESLLAEKAVLTASNEKQKDALATATKDAEAKSQETTPSAAPNKFGPIAPVQGVLQADLYRAASREEVVGRTANAINQSLGFTYSRSREIAEKLNPLEQTPQIVKIGGRDFLAQPNKSGGYEYKELSQQNNEGPDAMYFGPIQVQEVDAGDGTKQFAATLGVTQYSHMAVKGFKYPSWYTANHKLEIGKFFQDNNVLLAEMAELRAIVQTGKIRLLNREEANRASALAKSIQFLLTQIKGTPPISDVELKELGESAGVDDVNSLIRNDKLNLLPRLEEATNSAKRNVRARMVTITGSSDNVLFLDEAMSSGQSASPIQKERQGRLERNYQ